MKNSGGGRAYRYCMRVRLPMDGERGPVKKFWAKFLQENEIEIEHAN